MSATTPIQPGKGAMSRIAEIVDAFAKPPTLYYRGQAKISTVSGCCCTILIALVIFTFLLFDVLNYPVMNVMQYETFITDKDFSYNPFATENATTIQLSFGVKGYVESDFVPFSDYNDTFTPVLYHVHSIGSFDTITEIALVPCTPTRDNIDLSSKDFANTDSLLCAQFLND